MSDLGPFLDREAGRVHGDPGALDAVLHRAQRRRRLRRAATGAVALAIAAASLGLAEAAFRPGGETGAAGRPVAGPSVSPAPTPVTVPAPPAPLRIEILDGPEAGYLAEAVALWLKTEGENIREGGYRVVAVGEATYQPPHTLLLCPPQFDHESALLEETLFPGARIQGALPDDVIQVRIILGRDFARRDRSAEVYRLVTEFMDTRARGSGAERYLSDDAARRYAEHRGGLDLYDYARDGYRLTALSLGQGPLLPTVVVELFQGEDLVRRETLAVASADAAGRAFVIVNAVRND